MALTESEARFIRESAEQLAEELLAQEGVTEVVICEYDNDYARAHRANKYALFAFALIVPMAAIFALGDAFMRFIGGDTGLYLMLSCIPAFSAAMTAASVRLFPFITSSGAVWLILRDGNDYSLIRYMPYDSLKRYKEVLFERSAERYGDRWKIDCTEMSGRRRKRIIARAYPRLDEFLEDFAK